MSIERHDRSHRGTTRSGYLSVLFMCALCLTVARRAAPQGQRAPRDTARDTSIAAGITAGEADAEKRPRALINALNANLGFTTLRVGGGLLIDYIAYDQDSASREQFRLVSQGKLRDVRFLLGGRLNIKRPVTWQAGIMYDSPTKKWLFRQTGIMVAVPEIWSHFFIGRAKEGFSLNKVMVGYDGWSMERLPFNDATIPLLADGIKWLAITPDRHWFWNLGMFTDVLSEGQSFSSYNHQFVARIGWDPLVSDTAGTLLHIAFNYRTGDINNDTLQLRSRPEAFPAPYFIDTGKFPADRGHTLGPEIYYRPGRYLFGLEYYWEGVTAPARGNPSFHGGEAVFAWLTTGETRSFNTVGNYFRSVSPRKTVIEGGPGALEAVLKFSYSDLTNSTLQGGVFWRVTPMINWHLTDNLRLEFAYGFGRLNRFGTRGGTQFFQSRMQFEL